MHHGLGKDTRGALADIVGNVVKVVDLVGEIATGSGEQSRTIRAVTESIRQVAESAQAGSQQSNEVAAAALALGLGMLVQRGWQVKNTITNGLFYDNRDNIFNTTRGFRAEFSHDFVGNVLGGQDHYMRYYPQMDFFWWIMDYTFFNAIRKNVLRRWRIVQEVRASATFTQPTKPVYGSQDNALNPYVEIQDRLYLGGYESLRGWTLFDNNYQVNGSGGTDLAGQTWRNGGSHRMLFGSELRIPVEPSLFWLVLFFDAGALYQNLAEYSFSSTTTQSTLDAYKAAELNKQNFALSYFRYSWGFGFRLQIPILPLRIYLAKRLIWDDNLGWFRDHPNQSGFEFVFGIGDRRF